MNGLSRRAVLTASAGALLLPVMPKPIWAEAVLTEDGLYRQPWFIESLLELSDDLDAAGKQDKHFVLLWELRGCPYCKKMHEVNFGRADIADFVQARFDILQLNILGDREVVDFDGERLSEKRLAAKYGVRGTPTFQFFPAGVTDLGERLPMKREMARMFGYVEPDPFLKMFKRIAGS